MDIGVKSVGIIAVVVVVVVAAALALGGGGSGESLPTTSTTSPAGGATSPPVGGASTTTTVAGGASVEGKWSGRYTGSYGSGTWVWIIIEDGSGAYHGCLKTTGAYATSGWVPMWVNVSGDRISVGVVGGGAVTFTGKVSGSSASGTWTLAGGRDTGTWTGSREGPATGLPCQMGGSPTSTTPRHEPEGTTASLECNPSPPPSYASAYESLVEAVTGTLEHSEFRCNYATVLASIQYAAYFEASNASITQGTLNQLEAALRSAGWQNVTSTYSTDLIQISAFSYQGQPLMALISIEPEPDGAAGVVIQVQPAYG